EFSTINLNKIVNLLNLYKISKSNEILNSFNELNGKILILSNSTNSDNNIPLQLKNGKKIVLTNSNFDFSIFSHDELIEIFRLLDIMISDNRYDNLRCEIVKHIACISSVSIIK